ncbi:MAG: hypothetical protein ACJLS3_01725 [Erythrobacter sp.]
MSLRLVGDWLREHRWLAAFVCVVVFGYSYGKDMALRDNARDAAMVQGTE